MTDAHIYDVTGVGFGPSNIALAIALEEIDQINNAVFLEQSSTSNWQGEFLIPGSDIQHNPLRDFVTPRNPVSPYGFLSYLKCQDRLFEFLNLSAPFPPRSEYAQYVTWVAKMFEHHVRYGKTVEYLKNIVIDGIPAIKVGLSSGEILYSRTVSFAPGRSVNIPEIFIPFMGPKIVHATSYRTALLRWQQEGKIRKIAILGSSQSAVELMLDLPSELPDAQITGICRSYGIKQKDLSPFSERVYEPNFVNQFYAATEDVQMDLYEELLHSNYGAADHDVVDALHFRLYEQKVTGKNNIKLLDNSTITDIAIDGDRYVLSMYNRLERSMRDETFDAVILATGFKNHGAKPGTEPYHPLLRHIAKEAMFRNDGAIAQSRDYKVLMNDSISSAPIFLNGLSETTHGFGDAGSFSLLSVRSSEIAESIALSLKNIYEANNISNTSNHTSSKEIDHV